jgi:hypothetical protein
MLAIVAAIIFGLALVLDLADVSLGGPISGWTLPLAGLIALALHQAGIGTATAWGSWRRRR